MSQIKAAVMEIERPATSLGVALKFANQDSTFAQRRKKSSTELDTMTTVQEHAMDSRELHLILLPSQKFSSHSHHNTATIPGRPPLRDSCYGVSRTKSCQSSVENNKSFYLDLNSHKKVEITEEENFKKKSYDCGHIAIETKSHDISYIATETKSPRRLESSPRSSSMQYFLAKNHSPKASVIQQVTSPRSSSSPVKSAKSSIVHNFSQISPVEPPKPSSSITRKASVIHNPISAWLSVTNATMSAISLTSSSATEERSSLKLRTFGRTSPKLRYAPGRVRKVTPSISQDILPFTASKLNVSRCKSDASQGAEEKSKSSTQLHQRQASERVPSLGSEDCCHLKTQLRNSTSPSKGKISDGSSPIFSATQSNLDELSSGSQRHARSNSNHAPSRCTTPTSHSPERHSFLDLPSGYTVSTASQHLSPTELSHLRNQARTEAHRFHVLPSREVDSLSRELRALDERCDYLRKKHHSLRSTRQAIHMRICSNLRSPRNQNFSRESFLRHEETLSEMDRNIDACVRKLEQADNRQIRVRQKLLEHLAAAAILDINSPKNDNHENNNNLVCQSFINRSSIPAGENTPPRSPQKTPVSFGELHRGVTEAEEVILKLELDSQTPVQAPLALFSSNPSDILTEDLTQDGSRSVFSSLTKNENSSLQLRKTVHADDGDVFELMDSVEAEIQRMGM